MPTTIKYSNNPNSDTAFVVQDGGQKNRAVLTAEPAGTLQLSDSANVSTGYVTDEDGKKHKVNLVAQLEGDIEFSENPNSTKGYATVDGKKHRVVLTASLHGGGGSTPVIDELNVTPSTSAQTITAPEGTDGYSPVNVSAVTSAIDANIAAGNIKKDVTILGVTGSYEGVVPSGTKSITTNGIHDVAGYANADVNVPTSVGAKINLTMYNNNLRCSAPIDLTGITNFNMNCLSRTSNLDISWFEGSTGAAFINANDLTTISIAGSCMRLFTKCTGITSVDLPSLTTITGTNACLCMFYGCTGLISVNLPNLTTINGKQACDGMFYGCTGLTSISLPSLTTISGDGVCGSMFYGCTGLKSVYLPKIQSNSYSARPATIEFFAFSDSGLEVFDARNIRTVGNYGIFDNMLNGTNYLKTINVNSLEHIGTEGARSFLNCTNTTTSSLSNIYFPMLTSFGSNPFYTNAFKGRTNLTIHFRKDAQATVEALANYATLWGAETGSSVVFDLAGTLTGADSNSYARSEKDSVYASETAGAAKTATAWSYNNTIYYTSGGAEPSVGGTIYSDSACTQAVTTISSIA